MSMEPCNVSELLFDPMPLSVAPPADSAAFAEILLSFQSCCFPPEAEPVNDAGENEANGLAEAAAAAGVLAEVAGEERRSGVLSSLLVVPITPTLVRENLPAVPRAGLELALVEKQNSSGVDKQPPPAGERSRRGRKRKTDDEKVKFWNQKPAWLPEKWTYDVKQRKDGTRDRYYYDPKFGHRFRSRKEIERFITTGERPCKNKSKTKESNVMHTPSHSSGHSKEDTFVPKVPCSTDEALSKSYITNEDVPGHNIACSPTLEYLSKSLPGFKSTARDVNTAHTEIKFGMKRNQQSEGGAIINGQHETEGTTGIQQFVPSEVAGLRTIFVLETDKGSEIIKHSEREREEKGSPNSKSEIKANNAKQRRGRKKINQQSDLGKVAVGVQPSETERNAKTTKLSASSSISGKKASSSRPKKDLKVNRNILIQVGKETCKRAMLACIARRS